MSRARPQRRRAGPTAALAWVLALAACGEDPPPADPVPAQDPAAASDAPPSTSPAPAEKRETYTAAAVWTAATIGDLAPVVPERTAKVPRPLPASPDVDAALVTLRTIVQTYATDPDNPWAVGHGMLATGPDLVLSNGQPAVDWLFATYAERFQAAPDGPWLVRFPESKGKIRIEPHTDLLLKVMTETGVAPDKAITVQGQPHTVADLWRGSLVSTWFVPERNHSSFSSPNDMPWSTQALATWGTAGLRWQATDGTPMLLDDVVKFPMAVLVAETAFMMQAKQAGAGFQRSGQPLFNYTCGGAHLFQGATYAAARGHSSAQIDVAVQDQVALMYYRLPRELELYDGAMKQYPQYGTKLLVQRLKFVGHWLESMSKLEAMGIYSPTDEQLAMKSGAASQVVLVVKALEETGVLAGMPGLATSDEQLYLDVIGDSAHAIRGLQLARGEGVIRY